MSALHGQLADYLTIRRALGYRLERAEKLLGQYLAYLEQLGETTITIENASAWVTIPGGSATWRASRLAAVRGFAAYLHALDAVQDEVPPADLAPGGRRRITPYLYSDAEIVALMEATTMLRGELRQATYRTLIGLLAVTGMRVGEAIRLDRADVDLDDGVLTVRGGKPGKSRELPLHPSTTDALRAYGQVRDRLCRLPTSAAALISPAGTRLIYCNVHSTFRQLRQRAGLRAKSAACRPRIHDIRHAFAVSTLLDWYRKDLDVRPLLPLLSTYLGHVHPKDTYWYLTGAPELLAIAADRLQQDCERRS